MLWPERELPALLTGVAGKNFRSLRYPLWTQNKARLIRAYLQLFEFITHHGTYIDGFAAPQRAEHADTWAAKLVLELEPKWFRDFWLCDINPTGVQRLRALQAVHSSPTRRVNVLDGNFNERVLDILNSGEITKSKATFALLDQRTFECEWRTVELLARYKTSGNKIEMFYFFPTGWVDRSLAAVCKGQTEARVERWWGGSDWRKLIGMDKTIRARLLATRFEKEFGYKKAVPYPVHSERWGGRVMYHMIHSTDHPDAFSLMVRAYRKVSGRPELEINERQLDLEDFLNKIQDDIGAI